MQRVTAASIYDRLRLRGSAPRLPDALRGLAWASRALLFALVLLYIVSPWTEWFWSWDGFARGGQDMELGLMALIAVLCLGCAVMGRARLMAWGLLCRSSIRARMRRTVLPLAGLRLAELCLLSAEPDRTTPLRI